MTGWQAALDHRREVLDHLRHVLIDALRLDIVVDELDPDTPLFGTGLGLDSIDALELVVAVEDAFGVVLVEGEGRPTLALRTVNILLDTLLEKLGAEAE
ncbi:MAG: acyl carrier protein [Deltaproteobacteria bacterium]|jgi:acyl carrier protein|nr:acyl carrier protein [Deltaproteobacteria bacterium]